jgi:predicted alpha/beta-fold hydrolase
MPLVPHSSYRPPWWMTGGHVQTIVPALRRKGERVTQRAERIELDDGDFLDMEWREEGRGRLAILSHGLEADAGASYVQGMAGALFRQGWDVLVWSYRGCSGEMNRLPRFYHSGATEDLSAVIEHALAVHSAREIDLVGFSLGGNLTLKYLGEREGRHSSRLHRAAAISVPCDLACSSRALDSLVNRTLYMRRFIKSLGGKIRAKHPMFPERFDLAGLKGVRTFREFDDRYTAPLHGFVDAEDYWAQASSRQFLGGVSIPSLLVNAANDPFLGPNCYPEEEASASDFLHLEIPQAGGHVGFPVAGGKECWMESRVVGFLNGKLT